MFQTEGYFEKQYKRTFSDLGLCGPHR